MKLKNKLVLGTMKLKKYFKNSKDLSNFLAYAHAKGFSQFHVSNEYDSYNLLKKSIKIINKKKFIFILKLSEPKRDKFQFCLKRFKKKVNRYREDLGKKHTFIIQLVNRYQCGNAENYLIYEQKILKLIKKTIIELKNKKIIDSFYFFPYHSNINNITKHNFINGISVYRNIYEKNHDQYAKQNNFKIVAMRTFGGTKKIVNTKNLKRLLMFNLNNKLVKKVVLGINNKDQLDQLIKIW